MATPRLQRLDLVEHAAREFGVAGGEGQDDRLRVLAENPEEKLLERGPQRNSMDTASPAVRCFGVRLREIFDQHLVGRFLSAAAQGFFTPAHDHDLRWIAHLELDDLAVGGLDHHTSLAAEAIETREDAFDFRVAVQIFIPAHGLGRRRAVCIQLLVRVCLSGANGGVALGL